MMRNCMRRRPVATLVLLVSLAATVSCDGRGGRPGFDADSAYALLVEQCEFGPRYPGSPAMPAFRRYLAGKLRSAGANVSVQRFEAVLVRGDTLELVNILGTFNRDARHRVLLGAHYDTRPWADLDPDPANRGEPIPGANDGASGVAVLLEIARVLGRTSPPIGVDIVLLDGEDGGQENSIHDWILGSSHFARNLKGYRPNAVVIVDMIGEKDVRIPVEGYSGAASPALVDEIYGIAEELGYEAFTREQGVPVIDDHLPFIQAGLPAVNLIDFDYPYWHTLEDTPDKCSPRSLEAVGEVLLEFIWRRG